MSREMDVGDKCFAFSYVLLFTDKTSIRCVRLFTSKDEAVAKREELITYDADSDGTKYVLISPIWDDVVPNIKLWWKD